MSLGDWINVTVSLGTAATAYFTYRSAKHAGKMVQNASRPIIIVTPMRPLSLESIHKPTISIRNFGQGPAIIEEVQYFGKELVTADEIPFSNLEKPQSFKQAEPIISKPKDIVGPNEALELTIDTGYTHFFGEQEFVKYKVNYKDYVGIVYSHICEWNKEKGKWDHIGT